MIQLNILLILVAFNTVYHRIKAKKYAFYSKTTCPHYTSDVIPVTIATDCRQTIQKSVLRKSERILKMACANNKCS